MAEGVEYGVVGAGRQGTAAAYDMAFRGGAHRVVIADRDGQRAADSASRINRLTGKALAEGLAIDVEDTRALLGMLEPLDVFLCSVPIPYIAVCTDAAIRSGTSMVDLGGFTPTVLGQMELHEDAQRAGVTIVPDCGMGPGMNNTLGVYVVERLEARGVEPEEVRLWDGGLPVDPPEPWGYQCPFHIGGLTTEYAGRALALRGGRVTELEPLTEIEEIDVAGIGRLEAFITSGGTSTVPYTYESKLQVYENKTLRYPGHAAQFRAFKDLGLFSESPIALPDGGSFVPRDLFHALLGPQVEADLVIDVCVIRARGSGTIDGRRAHFEVEMIDRYDEATGFTAMERITGWHAAIMAQFIANGAIPPGVWPVERAIDAGSFLEAVRRRGFTIDERWEDG